MGTICTPVQIGLPYLSKSRGGGGHGLDFSLSFEKSYLISDEHDYYERFNEVDYQDYGQKKLVSYSGYEDFSEKQDYGTNNFFQTQYEDLSQKQDNQAFAIDVSTAQTYPSIIL